MKSESIGNMVYKSEGDILQDEDGTYLYVSTGGWNFRIEPMGGRFMVVFLNGGFDGGERVELKSVPSLREATALADRFGEGISKSKSKNSMSFSDMVNKQRNNNNSVNKTPIMQTMFIDNEDDLNRWGYNEAPIDIHEIASMCPNASVVPNVGSIEIIWYLPSGNHPGLWIHDHEFGNFVTVTGFPFDQPDEEGVQDFVGSLKTKSMDYVNRYVNVAYEQRKGMDKEEVLWYVRKMNDKLGDMSNPRGIPLGKSVRKATATDTKDRETFNQIAFNEMVQKQRMQNVMKSSAIGYDMSGLLFISDTIEVQGSELEVKHLGEGEYRLTWYGDIFWDVRVNNHGESFDLNYQPGVKYPSGKLTNAEWSQISDAIHNDIEQLDDLEDSIADNPMYSAYYSSTKKSKDVKKLMHDDDPELRPCARKLFDAYELIDSVLNKLPTLSFVHEEEAYMPVDSICNSLELALKNLADAETALRRL